MEYIHVKNLKHYQPSYTDGRNLIWIRWDIAALTNRKICKLPAVARWLFLVLVCLETEEDKHVEVDLMWLSLKSGIEKRHISNYIKMLQAADLIVTNCNKSLHSVPTDRQTDSTDRQTDNTCEVLFNFYLKTFNRNSNQYKLSPLRKQKIMARYKEFKNIDLLKQAIINRSKSKFHLGENESGKQYTDLIDHIFRNYEYTEKLIFDPKLSTEAEIAKWRKILYGR